MVNNRKFIGFISIFSGVVILVHTSTVMASDGDLVQAEMQNNTGVAYATGQGEPKNYAKAVYWFEKAAKQGLASAQNNIGSAYANGQGVPQDYAKAIYWYKKAAKQGYANAQYNLGEIYLYGQGVPKNYAKAAYWYKKAAKQDDAPSEFLLANLYLHGIGVDQSVNKGLFWLKKAASLGYPGASRLVQSTEKKQKTYGPLYVVKSRTYWVYVEGTGLCVPAAAFLFKNVGRNGLGTVVLRATFTNPAKKRIFATGTQWVNSSGKLPTGYTLGAMIYGGTGYMYSLGSCLKSAPKLHANVTAQIFNTGNTYTLLHDVPVLVNKEPYTYYGGQPMDQWVRNVLKNH